MGIHDGFYWTMNAPSDNDIDGDNDGVMVPIPNFLVDLSKVASTALGKQAPMMASYKLHSITIGLRPVDDVNDNEDAAVFAGNFLTYLATDHAKNALQLARKTEKASEEANVTTEGLFLRDNKRYTGFRYNWYSGPDNHVVEGATGCSVAGLDTQWNLWQIANLYDYMTRPDEDNALFNGRFPGITSTMWEASWHNEPHNFQGSATGQCTREMHTEILPLVAGNIRYSHVNEPGTVDDDYYVEIEVDFTIGGSF